MALEYFTITDEDTRRETHYRRRRWEERNNPNVPEYNWYVWITHHYGQQNKSWYRENDWNMVSTELEKKLEQYYQNFIRTDKLERICKSQ